MYDFISKLLNMTVLGNKVYAYLAAVLMFLLGSVPVFLNAALEDSFAVGPKLRDLSVGVGVDFLCFPACIVENAFSLVLDPNNNVNQSFHTGLSSEKVRWGSSLDVNPGRE